MGLYPMSHPVQPLLLESTEFWIVDFLIQQTQPIKQWMLDNQVEIHYHHHHHHHQPNLETGKDDQVIWVQCLNASSLTDSDTDDLFLSLDFCMPDGRSKDGEPIQQQSAFCLMLIGMCFTTMFAMPWVSLRIPLRLVRKAVMRKRRICSTSWKMQKICLGLLLSTTEQLLHETSLCRHCRFGIPLLLTCSKDSFIITHRLSMHKNFLKNQKRLIQHM